MKKILISMLLVCSMGSISTVQAQPSHLISKEEKLRQAMRELWMDHVIWTHEYIEAAADNRENTKLVADRLLKNQDDIGNAVAQFYGSQAGKKLAELLREHILIAADIITAAKAGQHIHADALDKRWHKNADDIAKFLSSANNNWKEHELQKMLYHHLSITLKEATARLQKQWAQEITLYDQAIKQILEMADMLAAGIISQFPQKFR